jgi:tetratricopeptide (TPR) repeat protein
MMANFDSDFSGESKFDEINNIEGDIKRYKELINRGELYNSAEAIEDLINSCQEEGLYEEGLYFIERLLEISPYNSEYWLKKGILLNNIFEPDSALECFERALSLNPADAETYIEKASSEEDVGLFAQAKESLLS